MFGLDSVFSTLSQGGSGLFGGGSEPQMSSATSGTGPTSFATGGLTVNKADTTTVLVVAGIAVVALLIMVKKR